MPSTSLTSALALSLTLPLVGCGGEATAEDEPGLTTRLQGLYRIDTWTVNETACDIEGPSVRDQMTDTKIAVDAGDAFGQGYVVAVPCVDAAECTQLLEAGAFAGLFGKLFIEGSDEAGWHGYISSWYWSDGTCAGRYVDHTMTASGATIRIESRGHDFEFSSTEAGCDETAAKGAGQAAPCTSLEVISATYESAL